MLVGCTTFGAISWRNFLIVARTPESLPHRLVAVRRPEARIAALWVGHATVLVQLDDKFVLTDPVFTRFVGGVSPRLVEPGIAVEHLPAIDAVLVSHRHFDHLSKGSLRQIAGKTRAVLVPVGAAADVPEVLPSVSELAWWQMREVDGLRITAVPVMHTGDRLPGDASSHTQAFTGFVIQYRGLTVFFAGDTAFDESTFTNVAARFPAIDLALMPIGPVAPAAEMLAHHMNPAQALRAAEILGAKNILPIHFDTFINSLDADGAVAAQFAAAARGSRRYPASSLLRIGEQRVFIARD
jgi:N-acyl-phosphatidylethanolamine-hydrolysing phospholipase D